MSDLLADYYRTTARYSPQLGGRDGLRGQIDAIVNELGLPASLDRDGDWQFAADVGNFLLIVHRESGDLVVVQNIQTLAGPPKKHVDELMGLLRLNLEGHGTARFSAVQDGGKDVLVLSARIRGDAVSRESVERMLADAMQVSRALDVALGNAPAEPQPAAAAAGGAGAANGSPPAGWYADPQGGGGHRWWDGAQWTAHTAP